MSGLLGRRSRKTKSTKARSPGRTGSPAHEQAQRDWTTRLSSTDGSERSEEVSARIVAAARAMDKEVGNLTEELAASREDEIDALMRYLICRDLSQALGFPRGLQRVLLVDAVLNNPTVGSYQLEKNLPSKLRALLPKDVPMEHADPGSELAMTLTMTSQRLFRILVFSSAIVEALKEENSELSAVDCVCAYQRAHAAAYDERRYPESGVGTTQRARDKSHQAFECEMTKAMESLIDEAETSFRNEAERTTLRHELIMLCAEEQVVDSMAETAEPAV